MSTQEDLRRPVVIAEPDSGIRDNLAGLEPFEEDPPVVVGDFKGLVQAVMKKPRLIIAEARFPQTSDSPSGSITSILEGMEEGKLPSVPVIIVTSRYLNLNDANEALGGFKNVQEVMMKPYSLDAIETAINKSRR